MATLCIYGAGSIGCYLGGRLLAAGQPRPGEVYLAVDFDRQKVYQPEEATRVVVEEGKVREIGKGLGHYDGVDCGFFLCTSALFDTLAEEAEEGRHALTDGIRALAHRGRANGCPQCRRLVRGRPLVLPVRSHAP